MYGYAEGAPRVSEPLSVDIIIDNFNYGRFLREAIESALSQTHAATRLIVVDDGSTDDSRAIIASYGDRLTAVFKDNGGQASALNTGFERSSGDVVIFLDADDVLLPHAVERVVQAFRTHRGLAKAHYRPAIIDALGRPVPTEGRTSYLSLPSGDLRRHELDFPFDLPRTATSANAFARSVLLRIFPIPEDVFKDFADWYLVHLASLFGPVAAIEEVCMLYRIHGTNRYGIGGDGLDLARVRKTIEWADRTRCYLEHHARQLRLPLRHGGIVSTSDVANRLISLKMNPQRHPLPDDSIPSLVFAGLQASLRRFDVRWPLKCLFIVWFAALAVTPRPIAQRLAELFLLPDRGRLVNTALAFFHR
jgi:glycosyltransferase involved in cell wall biosynthesis